MSRRAPARVALPASLQDFSRAQAAFLMEYFRITNPDDFARVQMLKLQEEVGEVAEAFLRLHGLQRQEKLTDVTAARAMLAEELADVILVCSVSAAAMRFDLEKVLATKIEKLLQRRESMRADIAAEFEATLRSIDAAAGEATDTLF